MCHCGVSVQIQNSSFTFWPAFDQGRPGAKATNSQANTINATMSNTLQSFTLLLLRCRKSYTFNYNGFSQFGELEELELRL